MRASRKISATIIFLTLLLGQSVFADIVINEVMYNLKTDSDDGREWVEITNTGSSAVAIATSTWRFFENNKNHELSLFQGSASIEVGGFAIIADDPQKFL